MKSLLLLSLMISSLGYCAELFNYESASTKVEKLNDSDVEKMLSNGPACIKDGNRIKKVNADFRAKRLKYGDCSNGDAATERAAMKGYKVQVIKLEQISLNKAKSLGLI